MRFQNIVIAMLVSISLMFCITALSAEAAISMESGTFDFSDDFSGYEDDTDGEPNWITDAATWGINNGYYTNNSTYRRFAKLNSPLGTDLSIESEVTLEKSTNANIEKNSFKASGIAVYLDDDNFWRLSLVELSNENYKHSVQLLEGYQGIMYAQAKGETKIKLETSSGNSFAWEYGSTYLLRILLDNNSVTGLVYDLNGNLKWKRKYLLTSDKCVRTGIPALAAGGFITKYDNVKVTIKNADYVNVTRIEVNPTALSIEVGDSKNIEAIISPDNATNKSVLWLSDKPEIATVNNGVVKGLSAGTAMITGKTADGGKAGTCTVKVTDSALVIRNMLYAFLGIFFIAIVVLSVFYARRRKAAKAKETAEATEDTKFEG